MFFFMKFERNGIAMACNISIMIAKSLGMYLLNELESYCIFRTIETGKKFIYAVCVWGLAYFVFYCQELRRLKVFSSTILATCLAHKSSYKLIYKY